MQDGHLAGVQVILGPDDLEMPRCHLWGDGRRERAQELHLVADVGRDRCVELLVGGQVLDALRRGTSFVELWDEMLGKSPVLGRGENPINFVAVDDVAAAVELACFGVDLRGRTLEIGRPENLTFNDLARLIAELRGESARMRHVPRGVFGRSQSTDREARRTVARVPSSDPTFKPVDNALTRTGKSGWSTCPPAGDRGHPQ